MQLYFAPLAASFAARLAIYEADLDVDFIEVNRFTKRLADGSDYRDVYRPGFVPALRTDDGTILTENPVVLAYLAERAPHLADGIEVRQWLSYIATELHKAVFHPFFDPEAPEAVKAYAMQRAPRRLGHVERHLEGRQHLAGSLSVADLYLFTVLMWTGATPIDLSEYPTLAAFHRRIGQRSSCVRAREIELPLYRRAMPRA